MKLRIIRNATVLVADDGDGVACYIADNTMTTARYCEIDDEQQSKIEAAIESGADFVEV